MHKHQIGDTCNQNGPQADDETIGQNIPERDAEGTQNGQGPERLQEIGRQVPGGIGIDHVIDVGPELLGRR